MKVTNNAKQTPYRKNSYRENSKSSYYNAREEQKPAYNFIEQTKIRIVQDNLVSVSGLSTNFSDPDLLGDNQHFGKYGTVEKIIISTQGKHRAAFIQVYITYGKTCDAAFAIKAMDGIKIQGRQISATFGTTKYCTYFLKQNECRNEKCFYLHNYDTKNELMDGVKNNLDFLDQKSQKIINDNLRYYLQKQYSEKQLKQQSQFPTIAQTIQYLIQQGILQQQTVNKVRKQIADQKLIKTDQHNLLSNSPKATKTPQNSQKKQIKQNGKVNPKNLSESNDQDCSNLSNNQSLKNQSDTEQDLVELTQIVNQLENNKNKKCHSLSTASSPTKYEKLSEIQQQTIDKTIERRIIKQIMRNNMIFRSKMDFVTNAATHAKQENNKMKNYVRKHLLNQI